MKKTYLMLLLALAGFISSCTNDDGTDGPTLGGTAGEIQLVFSGNGESTEYTKAIASTSENEIKTLKVYLFGAGSADAADTEWKYIETWEKADAATGTQFVLQPAGSSWKASITPTERKGYPHLTLVCIANQDKLYKANGADELDALVALTVDADGAVDNAAAATTLDAFKAAYTKNLGVSDILATPLAMTGTEKTKISGSVSKVSVTLKRIVARFDIDNTTSTSRLTITSVSLGYGRPNASLFGAVPAPIDVAGGTTAGLMTYGDTDFKAHINANQGTAESALYVYPGLATDQSFLIVKGKFSSPTTGQPVDVTYNVPVVKTPETATPTDPANYIAIDANSRYKLHITDVTESNIYATFEVEDWTSAGGVIIKPENAKPEVTDLNGTNTPALLSAGLYRTADAGTFNIVLHSTGSLEYKEEEVTKAVSWLTLGDAEEKLVDGITVTTFPVTVADATGKRPVTLTFINKAASYDPDLMTTLTFTGPVTAPLASAVEKGCSKGNTVTVNDGGKTIAATMKKEAGSYITLDMFCVDALSEITAGDGYEVKALATNGFTTTWRITMTDPATAPDTKEIEFANSVNTGEKATLTITKKTVSQPTLAAVDGFTNSTYNTATIEGTGGTYTTSMFNVAGSKIYVKATCTDGSVLAESNNEKVTVTSKGSGVFEIAVADATSLDGTTATITFKNNTDVTVTSTLEVAMNSAAMTLEAGGDGSSAIEDGGNGTYTIDMTTLASNTFTITVTAPGGAKVDDWAAFSATDTWLKLDGANAGAEAIAAGTPSVYTFVAGTGGSDVDITFTITNKITGAPNQTITLKKKTPGGGSI